jgi:hypothetical protein
MRRLLAVAAMVTLAVVTVVAVRSGPRPAVAEERARRAQREASAVVESTTRDVEGIRRFATTLTERAERQVPMPVDEAVAMERALATRHGADALAARVARDLEALDQAGDRATMSYWVAPLAMRVTNHTAQAATVQVWQVGALEIAGVRTTQHWVTVTYDVVWERGGWRLDAERSSAGPQPQTLAGTSPDSPGAFGVLLEGFESVGATR